MPTTKRGPRRGSGPTVSVVVASSRDRASLHACLVSLVGQCQRLNAELLVARAASQAEVAAFAKSYPTVRFLVASAESTSPQLRALGMAQASGDVVALTEDHCVADENWVEALGAIRDTDVGVGTLVGARRSEAVDWVAPFAESSPATDRLEREPTPAPSPLMSVVVAVYEGEHSLSRCLAALRDSEMPVGSWELIVVDDASTDATPLIAAEFSDVVVRLPDRPRGPAYARNRGVEVARGEIVVFIDADVCVHRDTLRRFASELAAEPNVSAVFGSYDTEPEAPQFVSQYRNLLHHFVHSQNAGEAETFWGGCGAIRRQVFLEAGRYDEWSYPRPQIEDVELGHRVRELGHRILLRPEIQCTHLKRWTLRGLVTGDFLDRGVPWARMLIQQGIATKSRTLNLRTIEKLNTVLVWLAMVEALAGAILRSWLPVAWSGIAIAIVVLLNRSLYNFFIRTRGVLFALAVLPLHTLYYVSNGFAVLFGWALHHLFGNPTPDATTQAYAEVGVDMWPPVPAKQREAGQR